MITLSWARVFPGTPAEVPSARGFVRSLLTSSPYVDDAALVVTELFTNAVLHSSSGKPGGLVTVQVSRWRLGVRIAVTDQGSQERPVIHESSPTDELAESGSGLYIVRQMAAELDWHDDACGRTVSAVLGTCVPEHRERHLPTASPPRGLISGRVAGGRRGAFSGGR